MEFDKSTRRFTVTLADGENWTPYAVIPGARKIKKDGKIIYSVPEICSRDFHNATVRYHDTMDVMSRIYSEGAPVFASTTDPNTLDVDTKCDSIHLEDYQKLGALWLRQASGRGLGDDVGLGKTVQVLLAYESLRNSKEVDRLMVFCPKNVIDTWKRQFEMHLGREVTDDEVLITNYSQLICASGQGKIKRFLDIQRKSKKTFVCIDEIHNLAGVDSQRYKMMDTLLLGRKLHLVATSGTFIRDRVPSFFGPYRLLTRADLTLKDFEQKFLPFGVAVSSHELACVTVRFWMQRTAQEVKGPDVNKKIISTVYLDIAGKQKVLYNTLMNEYKELLAGDAKQRGQALGKLQQVVTATSHPVIWDKDFKDADVAKMSALEDILNETNETVVVWSQHPSILQRVAERFKDKNPVCIPGGLSEQELENRQHRIRTDDKCKLILLSIGACHSGMDGLQHKSAVMIFFDGGWKPSEYTQAYARLARLGQTKLVRIYHLIYRNTKDQDVFECIQDKLRESGEALGKGGILQRILDTDINSIIQNNKEEDMGNQVSGASKLSARRRAVRSTSAGKAAAETEAAAVTEDDLNAGMTEPGEVTVEDIEADMAAADGAPPAPAPKAAKAPKPPAPKSAPPPPTPAAKPATKAPAPTPSNVTVDHSAILSMMETNINQMNEVIKHQDSNHEETMQAIQELLDVIETLSGDVIKLKDEMANMQLKAFSGTAETTIKISKEMEDTLNEYLDSLRPDTYLVSSFVSVVNHYKKQFPTMTIEVIKNVAARHAKAVLSEDETEIMIKG